MGRRHLCPPHNRPNEERTLLLIFTKCHLIRKKHNNVLRPQQLSNHLIATSDVKDNFKQIINYSFWYKYALPVIVSKLNIFVKSPEFYRKSLSRKFRCGPLKRDRDAFNLRPNYFLFLFSKTVFFIVIIIREQLCNITN